MPSLGADMEHGKIVEWLVKPGDYVRRGDLVAVVDTDKTVMDVESFQEGVVADLLVGIALASGLFINAVFDPLIGSWSDRTRSRWGRRHPFMFASIART